MNFPTLLSKPRNRRLSLALLAALLVHLCLGLTGNWGILLFSAPSNQDRTLTLTLENTPYEGLKESSAKEQETVNDAQLGRAQQAKAKQAPKEYVEQEKQPPKVMAQSFQESDYVEPEPEQKSEELIKPKEAPLAKNVVEPETIKKQTIETENIEAETVTESPVSPDKIIAAKETSLFKVRPQPIIDEPDQLVQSPSQKELEDTDGTELDSNRFNKKELKMLDKKINRWASSPSKYIQSNETLVWEDSGQEYAATFTEVPAEHDMDNDEVVIDIATQRDGRALTTSLRLKKMAFSNFAQFVHQWDDKVSIHDDEMNGRFHSNTTINVQANRSTAPLFHGKVTTASYSINIDGSVPRRKIFLAGIETGVKRISMPKPAVLFGQVQLNKTSKIVLIQESSRIVFGADGRYFVQGLTQVGALQPFTIGDRPLYILAAPGASLLVSGTVNGAVAVYSPKRITIEGSLEYASSDSLEQGGDFLGLISGRSVVIAKRSSFVEGDVDVQAAIYAKNRFETKQLTGDRMGTLNILGSVSAGSITATEPRYATNIVFDTRLEHLRPPGFPVTDRYEVLAQQNGWQIEDDPFYESTQDSDEEPLDDDSEAETL